MDLYIKQAYEYTVYSKKSQSFTGDHRNYLVDPIAFVLSCHLYSVKSTSY